MSGKVQSVLFRRKTWNITKNYANKIIKIGDKEYQILKKETRTILQFKIIYFFKPSNIKEKIQEDLKNLEPDISNVKL